MSKYADEGSIAHVLFSLCLTEDTDAAAYVGRVLECTEYKHALLSSSGSKKWIECPGSVALEAEYERDFEPRTFNQAVTDDMARFVQISVDGVRQRIADYKLAGAAKVELLVEKKLSLQHITGEEGGAGTGDVILVVTWEDGTTLVEVIDLKFGIGVVVPAIENTQLMMYGLGVLEDLGLVYDIVTFRLAITQPRVKAEFSEWTIGLAELELFGAAAQKAAKDAMLAYEHRANWTENSEAWLNPGEHCSNYFCKAQATCPALAKFVQSTIGADFDTVSEAESVETCVENPALDDDDGLGTKMKATDIIEAWLKAVRAEVERRLQAGIKVPGFKLVTGKRGARAWTNATEAEAMLKGFRLKHDQIFEYSLISPTKAEKLTPAIDKKTGKPKEGQEDRPLKPKQWEKLQAIIGQAEGKESVAPESDPRPAIDKKPPVDDFTNDTTDADDLAG